MTINHNIVHYAIGGLALAMSVYGIANHVPAPEAVGTSGIGIHEHVKPGRHDWPSLGEEKTISLGESLKGVSPGRVTIYCSEPSCRSLSLDLDDAFQVADWQSDFESRFVDSEADKGIFVGPPGPDAEKLAAAVEKATGEKTTIVGIDGIDGLGIIIGKFGGAK